MIDLRVDLLPAEVATKCEYGLGTVSLAAGPPVARYIQAVSHFIVVRDRHLAEGFGNKTRGIHTRAERVPRTCRSGGSADLRVGAIGFCRDVRDGTKQA